MKTPTPTEATKLSTLLQGLDHCRDATLEQSETTFAFVGAEAFHSRTGGSPLHDQVPARIQANMFALTDSQLQIVMAAAASCLSPRREHYCLSV
jgi:hypothetical protein